MEDAQRMKRKKKTEMKKSSSISSGSVDAENDDGGVEVKTI